MNAAGVLYEHSNTKDSNPVKDRRLPERNQLTQHWHQDHDQVDVHNRIHRLKSLDLTLTLPCCILMPRAHRYSMMVDPNTRPSFHASDVTVPLKES